MAVQEIRVFRRDGSPEGANTRAHAERSLGTTGLTNVEVATIYRLEGVDEAGAVRLAQEILADPIDECFSVNGVDPYSASDTPVASSDTPAATVEVAYKPGVMNPASASILKAAESIGIELGAATSSKEYSFFGNIQPADVDTLVNRLLVNKTVQHIVQERPRTLASEGSVGPVDIIPVRGASESELSELSKDKLFLDRAEMGVIQKYFRKLGRDPTDAELEVIAGRWSEHCGHKTFSAKLIVDGAEKPPLFERIKTGARRNFGERVISAFDDNSGVIRFYDGLAICGKVETHNSPSALEPYGGAMTGSGGVFRDIVGTGQGAKAVISTDMFCLAPPDLDESLLPPNTLDPEYMHRRLVDGVRDYGNRTGIPTGNGSVHYHEDFRAKPSVIVGAYGILPESRAQKGEPQVGDLVVVVGGKTGLDGIHGATFSSGEMTDRTAEVNSNAVQIGNPIEEKRTFDALLEARDADCIRAMTDCGAAGFSSAIGEIAEDVGATVDISLAPLKYDGLAPWQIWLSESQERMVVAVPPNKIEAFRRICEKHNAEMATLGTFDGSNTLTVNYGDQNVVELDYEFLKEGLPQRVMRAHYEQPDIPELHPQPPESPDGWIDVLKSVLSHGNVCSKEPIVRQYDHGVQGGTIVSPFGGSSHEGPNDAFVVRPELGTPYGIVQSHGINPVLNRLDPYLGSIWATTEAMANFVAVGGNPSEAALVGNYIAAKPDEETMGALDRIVDGAVDMMDLLGVPVISGKDSLSSTYVGQDGTTIKVPPVYCVSAFGRIPDVEKTTTSSIKQPGKSALYLIGKPSTNMGGSTYYDVAGGSSGKIPNVDTKSLPAVLQGVHKAIENGDALACHDISEGGLVTTVAEMCFGSNTGAHIFIPKNSDPQSFLFSETAGCFVVELDEDTDPFEVFPNIPHTFVASTRTDQQFSVIESRRLNAWGWDGSNMFETTIAELKQAWQQPLKELFE